MKKYKVSISFFNLFEKTSKEVTTLQVYTKAIAATLAGLMYLTEEQYTLYVAIAGFIVDSFFHFISIDCIENKGNVNTKQ